MAAPNAGSNMKTYDEDDNIERNTAQIIQRDK